MLCIRRKKFPLSCKLSVGTNGSNTKETFLSVPVLRKVFLSGNQPLQVRMHVCNVLFRENCTFREEIAAVPSGLSGLQSGKFFTFYALIKKRGCNRVD